MRKAIVLLALIGGGVLVWRYSASHGAEAHYKQFAEEVLKRHYDVASGMADGLTPSALEKLGTQEHIGAGPPMFQQLFPSRFRIDSSEKEPGGGVTLHATQTVLFNPVGVESAVRPAMYATMKQVVTMRKESGGWRVTAFSNTCEKFDSTSTR